MIPYSYANMQSSISIYFPIIIALILVAGTVAVFFKFKDKIMDLSDKKRIIVFVGTFAVIGCICTLMLTIPYKAMSPSNEKAKFEVISTSEIIDCNIDNQTVTYLKGDAEVTEDTLITITYDEPHLEVRRYSWCGMYRDYNVTLIQSPDAIKVEE